MRTLTRKENILVTKVANLTWDNCNDEAGIKIAEYGVRNGQQWKEYIKLFKKFAKMPYKTFNDVDARNSLLEKLFHEVENCFSVELSNALRASF